LPAPIGAGKEILNGVKIERLSLDPDVSVPMDPATHADMKTQIKDATGTLQTYTRYPVRLHAVFGLVDGSGISINRVQTSTGIDLGLPLFVWTDATRKITSCFGPVSSGTFCNLMGGYYVADPISPLPQSLRCRQSIYTQAFINGAFANVGSCRYGGYTETASECDTRFNSVYDNYPIETKFKPMIDHSSYLCMLCQ
jgi:hypothetical protein